MSLPPPPGVEPPLYNPPNSTPEQLRKLQAFGVQALSADTRNLRTINEYVSRSYTAVFVMYCTLFVIGIGAAVAAIIKGYLSTNGGETIPALIFAGLSAASFFTIFITRPLESLERNAIFSTWLIAAVSSYWTRLMYFDDPKTIDTDIQQATSDLIQELSNLADKYATAYGKYQATPDPNADAGVQQRAASQPVRQPLPSPSGNGSEAEEPGSLQAGASLQ